MSKVTKISRRELAGAIDKAVDIATSRHKLTLAANHFGRDEFRLPPFINGRILREFADLDQAYKTAETIVENMQLADANLQAVALKIDKDILVGFIERFGDQFEFQDLPQGGAGY